MNIITDRETNFEAAGVSNGRNVFILILLNDTF